MDLTTPIRRTFPTLGGRAPSRERLRRGKARLEGFAWFVEDALPIPWTDKRIGVDAVVGLLPIAGDVATAILQLYLVLEAMHLGVSGHTLLRMAGNVVIDAVIGMIPVIGDLWDVGFRATRRNVRLVLDDVG